MFYQVVVLSLIVLLCSCSRVDRIQHEDRYQKFYTKVVNFSTDGVVCTGENEKVCTNNRGQKLYFKVKGNNLGRYLADTTFILINYSNDYYIYNGKSKNYFKSRYYFNENGGLIDFKKQGFHLSPIIKVEILDKSLLNRKMMEIEKNDGNLHFDDKKDKFILKYSYDINHNLTSKEYISSSEFINYQYLTYLRP